MKKRKNDLERLLRDSRDEIQTLKQNIEKISDTVHKFEEQSKQDNNELTDLKLRLQKALEQKQILEKSKVDLEKDLGDQKFSLQDIKDKTQRESDSLNKKNC